MSPKILLVDDEKDFTELTSTMLKFHDFETETTDQPTAVADLITKTEYDLIVTDLMMPNLDGFQLIRHIRGQDNYKETPIIVLTAKTLSDEERKFLLQNNAHVMFKPFEPQGLVEQIQEILGQS